MQQKEQKEKRRNAFREAALAAADALAKGGVLAAPATATTWTERQLRAGLPKEAIVPKARHPRLANPVPEEDAGSMDAGLDSRVSPAQRALEHHQAETEIGDLIARVTEGYVLFEGEMQRLRELAGVLQQ